MAQARTDVVAEENVLLAERSVSCADEETENGVIKNGA
jgi:hypothetical protein